MPGDGLCAAVVAEGVVGDEAEATCVTEATADPDGPPPELPTLQPDRRNHEAAAIVVRARCRRGKRRTTLGKGAERPPLEPSLNLFTFVNSKSPDQETIAIGRARTREAGVA